ncbi:MAG: TonB-dependent receptor [Chitinophagales bacterium]|nr:TonB-dependent receptor [Chitinophagales bacterium]
MTPFGLRLRIALPLLLMLVQSLQLFAQYPGGGRPGGQNGAAGASISGRFYGKLLDDATGKPVAYASVQLLAMRRDTVNKKMVPAIVGGQLTGENGEFSIENLPVMGEFTLKIICIGYNTLEQKVSFGKPGGGRNAAAFDKDLGNIRLSVSQEVLKEVTINAEANKVTLALDKKVYRVDKDGVAAGGTAEDAMRNVPSVQVDIDGNVTLRNAAPQLFVDGRPTQLTLDQIPADAIESIEVITNPSAKYDASGGNAGIVNVVLKKDRRVGYNGNINAGVDMRGRINVGGDLNVRDGKINAFIGGRLNQRRSISNGVTERQNLLGFPTTDVLQNTRSVNDGYFANGRAGFDWFINNRNTLTFSGNLTRGDRGNEDVQDILTDTLFSGRIATGEAIRTANTDRIFKNYSGQVLYKHLFPKEGKEWTADVNYNAAKSSSKGNFNTVFPNSLLAEALQRQDGSGRNDFTTIQTDFVNPLRAGEKMEFGARAALRQYESENAAYQFDYVENVYVRVRNFADRYAFDDQVYAAYVNYAHAFKKFGFQTGLRAESSRYSGTLLDTDSTFTNSYPLSLFPSVFLNYKLNEEDNIQLNYSRRINRPSFWNLIPFPDFSDSLSLSRGNPGLLPEFTNSLELSYQNVFSKGNNLLATLYYKQANDLITNYQYSEYIPELGRDVIVSSFENANSSIAYGAEFTLRNTFLKIVELNSNLNVYNSIVDASNVESSLKVEQFSWFIKENLSLRLPQAFTVQFSGSYQSRTAFSAGGGGGRGGGGWGGGTSNTAQGYSIPVWFVDFSLRKDIWKKKATITLNVQDIFRSRRQGSHAESFAFIQDSWRRRDPQLARLNFSYRFGKFDVSLFRRKNTREEDGGEF